MRIELDIGDRLRQLTIRAIGPALGAYERAFPAPQRMGERRLAPADDAPIVIVPPFAADARFAASLARSLSDDGHRSVTVFDDPNRGLGSVEQAARGVRELIEGPGGVLARTGADHVRLITMSAGVTVARTYISLLGGAPHVRQLIAVDGSWRGDDDSRLLTQLRTVPFIGPVLRLAVPTAVDDLQQGSPLYARLNAPGVAEIPAGVRVTTISPQRSAAASRVDHPAATNVAISDRYDHLDTLRRSDEMYTAVQDALRR